MKEFPTYFTSEHALSMTMRDYFAAKAMLIAIRLFEEDCKEIPYITEDGFPMQYLSLIHI